MKKLILLSFGIILCAGIAYGQGGYIGLFVDPVYTACEFDDVIPALVPVYAVHKSTPGSTASQWRLQTGNGFNCIFTGSIVHMPTSIGDVNSGISLGYGGCFSSDILLVTVNYFCQGISPPCASVEVVGDPGSGSGLIEVVDCDFVLWTAHGSLLYVNPDGSCDCGEIVPAQKTSWGEIKSLYGD